MSRIAKKREVNRNAPLVQAEKAAAENLGWFRYASVVIHYLLDMSLNSGGQGSLRSGRFTQKNEVGFSATLTISL